MEWEVALDVDDSDIPSLIRPCKRRRSIPGPAAAVQSAMLRKTLDRQNLNNSTDDDNGLVISTQDYIQKAVEDTAEFDDDFTRNPWLSALKSLGVKEGLIPGTPISSIKKCTQSGKVDQVVAVVKSCTPNGLGGLIMMLKDPTGTVGASVHHKVLCESESGKNLTVGAVLILHKVAIFSPVRSSQYLNITLKNLVKVFCPDSDTPLKQDSSARPPQYAHPAVESGGKANTFEDISIVQNIETQEITDGGRQNSGKREHMENHSLIQKQNLFARSFESNGRASSGISAALKRGHSEISRGVCNEVPEDRNRGDLSSDQQQPVDEVCHKSSEDDSLESAHINIAPIVATKSLTKSGCEEIEITDEAQMKRQPLIVKPSLPQWTDEQLNELFAGDENDGLLF